MLVELLMFRLVAGADEAAFLEADKRLQAELMLCNRGLVRRTTARGDDGDWLVVTLWWSADEAGAGSATAGAAHTDFMAFVDDATAQVKRYVTLD